MPGLFGFVFCLKVVCCVVMAQFCLGFCVVRMRCLLCVGCPCWLYFVVFEFGLRCCDPRCVWILLCLNAFPFCVAGRSVWMFGLFEFVVCCVEFPFWWGCHLCLNVLVGLV